jgi:hypothetical protein
MIEFKLNNEQIRAEKTFTCTCQIKRSKHGDEAIR